MECKLLRSPMISYRSLLYNTTVLYDTLAHKTSKHSHFNPFNICASNASDREFRLSLALGNEMDKAGLIVFTSK